MGIVFSVPGLAGISLGAEIGRLLPGRHPLFVLGLLLFGIAAWVVWLSMQDRPPLGVLRAAAEMGRERWRVCAPRSTTPRSVRR